ncbi:MAG TPA: hypothetical protein VKD71_06295 [Gemmataceae bacterium]|nr:hypothetical protein [Gemmataceae bacterium]
MLARMFRFAVLALAIATPASFADEQKKDDPAKKSAGPALLVRVQSVNDLIKTVEFIGSLLPADQAEQVKQGLGVVKDLIDEKKGIEGIDVHNPIGLYVTFGEEVGAIPPVVVLVPVADEDTLLAALKDKVQLTVEKEKDGSYKTQPKDVPFSVHFRFANKYAYVTVNDPANIDPKTLPKPADILGGRPEHLVSATLRIDRLPENMKLAALAAVEQRLAMGKDQKVPNETKAIKDFKDKAIDELATNLKSLLEGGEEVALRLNVDPKAEEVALELELAGAKGSKLAKDIASIRENKSVVGGALGSSEAAMTFNLSVGLSSSLKQFFPPVIDDVLEQAKKQAPIPGEFQAKAEPLIKALLPTVKAGELDLGAAMIGPDKDEKYTFLIGIKVVDGKKIEGAIKDIVKKELPPEIAGVFQLDADKLSGGASLHVVKIADQIDAKGQKVIGKSDLYFTFRDDLIVLAIGPQAKPVLEKAVASKPADVGVLRLQVALSRIVPIMGEDAQELAAARKAAEKVFGKGAGKADLIKFSIDGGDSLKIKLSAQGKAIQFLAEVGVNQAKKDQ